MVGFYQINQEEVQALQGYESLREIRAISLSLEASEEILLAANDRYKNVTRLLIRETTYTYR